MKMLKVEPFPSIFCSEVAFVSTANALGDIDHGVIGSKVDSNVRLVDTTQRLLHSNYRAICGQV